MILFILKKVYFKKGKKIHPKSSGMFLSILLPGESQTMDHEPLAGGDEMRWSGAGAGDG